MQEREIVLRMNEMCIESLSPDVFEKWEEVKKALELVRKDLSPIDWEIIEWSEQKESLAFLDGVDQNGIKYEATGLIALEEIEEIYNIEKI